MQKFTFRISVTAVIILSSAVFLSGCSQRIAQPSVTVSPTPSPASSPTAQETKKKANYEYTATEGKQVALDLLMSNATIETKDYGNAGKFVTSINGLQGNNDNYWAFYLNGKYAEKGASQTILKKGDVIKFIYEPVTPNK
jgi:hypothetical protein